jgi:hypothetical protein
MKTAIVAGAVANKYLNGGAVWTRLNWALGMKKLGFKVYFLEQISRENCLDEQGLSGQFEHCMNLKYFRRIMGEFGLADTSALICDGGRKIDGMSGNDLNDLLASADLLINISGHLSLQLMSRSRACKIYIDLDPGFTQYWHRDGLLGEEFKYHDHFFTIGEAIGTPDCHIPTGAVPWQSTRQPVVLDLWPVSDLGDPDRFTTVAAWRDSYGPLENQGQTLGVKVHEFRKFIQLPEYVPQTCEIALDIHPDEERDLKLLHSHGWKIEDPGKLVPDPNSFRRYVQESGAEFSVAKQIYVKSNSGWFSDRTVRYMASGKPVLVQDTGFSKVYPVGEGLLAFTDLKQAIAGAGSISMDYARHCQAARSLAEEWFDSDKVLADLVERAGILP